MRIAPIISTLLVTSTIAAAQPGAPQPQPQPQPYAPQPQPYAPQPQPYAPQPGYPPAQPGYPPAQPGYPTRPAYPGYGPQPQVQITPEEQQLLAQGEITDGQHVGGAAVAFFVGFGAGQAVQGRWSDKGWIFTLGEVATVTMMIYGLMNIIDDCNYYDPECGYDPSNNDRAETMLVVGALGYAAFHVWEVIDAIAAPSSHNARVRELRVRTGQYPGYYGMKPFIAPARDQGMTAGVTFNF